MDRPTVKQITHTYLDCEHTVVVFDRLSHSFELTTTGFDGTTETAYVGVNEARGLIQWMASVIEDDREREGR